MAPPDRRSRAPGAVAELPHGADAAAAADDHGDPPAADPTLGDIFLTPADGGSQAGPMIVNPAGQLVWFAPEPPGDAGRPTCASSTTSASTVLTYWQGRIVLGHGSGSGVIDNASYQQIAHGAAGNGLSMDLHDFDLEPDGVALITVYEPVCWNLSAGHGPPARGAARTASSRRSTSRPGS